MSVKKLNNSFFYSLVKMLVCALLLFSLSKFFQDIILSERSYGHGRVLYPSLFACTLTVLNFYLEPNIHKYSRWMKLLLSIGLAWISSAVAMLFDAAIFTDFWFQITSSWRNLNGAISSIIFSPWIILTPIIGGAVTMLLTSVRRLK